MQKWTVTFEVDVEAVDEPSARAIAEDLAEDGEARIVEVRKIQE